MVTQEPIPGTSKVRVTFMLPASIWADTIHLVGDFNHWSPVATPLRLSDTFWSVSLEFEAGRTYQYRYLIDGVEWLNDCHLDRSLLAHYGSSVSVVVTPSGEQEVLGCQDVCWDNEHEQVALVEAQTEKFLGIDGWRRDPSSSCPLAGMWTNTMPHHSFCARPCDVCPFQATVLDSDIEFALER